MTAEEFVKEHYPKARVETHRTNGPLGDRYYLVRIGRETMWFSEGTSKSNAWVNAKKKIKELQKK